MRTRKTKKFPPAVEAQLKELSKTYNKLFCERQRLDYELYNLRCDIASLHLQYQAKSSNSSTYIEVRQTSVRAHKRQSYCYPRVKR